MVKKISEVHFRIMGIQDLPLVQELDKISFHNPWPEGAFKYELLESHNSLCWVAEIEEDYQPLVVASIIIWLIVDEAHVATLAVNPDYRSRGIGRRLMATALLDAYQKGARKSLLEARQSNQYALHLYYGFGFEMVGIRPGYYPDNHEDALLLTLDPLDPEKLTQLTAV